MILFKKYGVLLSYLEGRSPRLIFLREGGGSQVPLLHFKEGFQVPGLEILPSWSYIYIMPIFMIKWILYDHYEYFFIIR